MATRIGVDVGGTFTDLIFYDEATGEIASARSRRPRGARAGDPATPSPPASRSERLQARAEFFLHGTTVGLNALLERARRRRRPARARSGFRDVLEIRRGDRDDPYDLFWQPARRRSSRASCGCRCASASCADGSVAHAARRRRRPRARRSCSTPRASTRVAVAFLQRLRQPRARAGGRASRCARPASTGEISLSHQVSRRVPRVRAHLDDGDRRLRAAAHGAATSAGSSERLRRAGFDGESLDHALRRRRDDVRRGRRAPVRDDHVRARSPAPRARPSWRARSASSDVITADVGGTSFDTCLITDGAAAAALRGRASSACRCRRRGSTSARSAPAAARSPTSTPAGCCASARGAPAPCPGPACYGRGGTEPTVTDAAVAARHARRRASSPAASRSTRERGARPRSSRSPSALGFERRGRRAAASLHDRRREHGRTRSARSRSSRASTRASAALMPFGGAGPLFAHAARRRARDRQHRRARRYAGNFSAWGLLGADLAQTTARTRIMPLDDAGAGRRQRARSASCSPSSSARRARRDALDREAALDMRYVGQEHTLTIAVAERRRARRRQRRRAARALRARVRAHVRPRAWTSAVEIVVGARDVRAPLPRRAERAPPRAAQRPAAAEPARTRTRSTAGERLDVRARRARRASASAQRSQGPAIVARADRDDLPRRRLRAPRRTSPGALVLTAQGGTDATMREPVVHRAAQARRAAPPTPTRSRPRSSATASTPPPTR